MESAKFSPIQFKREIKPSRLLQRDSSGEPSEIAIPVEFRFDPLTGESGRLVQFNLERIIRPNLEKLERRSRELTCPFCPPLVEKIVPGFPAELIPEGNIHMGRALAFPNINPYDIYSTVVVISEEHFTALDEFTPHTVFDALLAAHTYIKRVQEYDPKAKYSFIAWNYMPASGGSLVHPHLQCNAGYFPTYYQKQLLEASLRYYENKGTNYWSDLIEQERQTGERYVGTIGNSCWLTSFMPKGRLSDVLAVFPGKASITELSEDDLHDLTTGLLRVFGYIDELNLVSFNLATYSGFDKDNFWAHVRITPRGLLLYSPIETSDQFYYQILQDENICILPPEVASERLKRRFSG